MLENVKIDVFKIKTKTGIHTTDDFNALLSMFLNVEWSSMNVYNKLVSFDFTYAPQTLILFFPLIFFVINKLKFS